MDIEMEVLRQELRLMIDASLQRHETLFGEGRDAALEQRGAAAKPELASYPVTALIERLYDYVVHAVWNTDKDHLLDSITDAMDFRESCREFVASACSIHFTPMLLRLIDTAQARWKVDEGGDDLTIKEIALLAKMDERSVRNATAKANGSDRLRVIKAKGDVCADPEHILNWLAGRRAWKPTRFVSGKDVQAIAQFSDRESFVSFVASRMATLTIDIHEVVERMNLDPADTQRVRQVLEGEVPCPLADALALARALEFDEARFMGLLLEAFYQPQLRHIRNYLVTTPPGSRYASEVSLDDAR